jgi:hypothetical protein
MTKKEKCENYWDADHCLQAMRSTGIDGLLEESQKFCGEFTNFVVDMAVLPSYAASASARNAISRFSSACSCLPTP